MLNKKFFIVGVLLFLLLNKAVRVNAATVFFDTFLGGFNETLWVVGQNMTSPAPSAFGIADTNTGSFHLLISTVPSIPNDNIVKFDMKINNDPSAVWFACNDSNNSDNERRVALRANGTFTFEVFLNGGGLGSNFMTWDNSAGIHTFKFSCLGSLMTLEEDGVHLGSWIHTSTFNSNRVRFFFREGDTEFANYQLCDTNGCDAIPANTPTPTSTPIPTPTNTSTPTLTPTPTPPSSPTKVIIVPGMGGSWSDAILSCSLDTPGTWTRTPYYGDTYDPLMHEIENRGYTAVPFYYDWRKPIPSQANEIKDFIHAQTQHGEKVLMVGHSMGGLVGRAYLTEEQNDNKLDRFITVGSPHRGAAQAYGALSGGELWTDDKSIKFIDTVLKNWCAVKKQTTLREVYTNLVPSFFDILPIDDYLKNQKSGTFKPIASMNLQNNWLTTNSFTSPFFGIAVGALSGNSHQTIKNIQVKDPNKTDQIFGDWTDGRPTQKENTPTGDGTVLSSSSTLPNATNLQINQDHSGIINSSEGIDTILNFLGLGAPNPTLPLNTPELESSIAIIADPAWFWITDPKGKTVNSTQGLIVIANPQNGTYKFRLIPKTLGKTRIAVAQFLKNGQILWKEYGHNGILPKFASLNINSDLQTEDILH